jgi:hypothetical protein
MSHRRYRSYVAVAFFFSCLSACKTTSTTLGGSWINPAFQGTGLSKLFVIGTARKQANRELYETVMADAVRKQGAEAEASFRAMGQSKRLTKSEARAAIDAGGFDGVIFTHVLHVDDQLEYHEAKTTQVPTSNLDLYMTGYDQRYETVTEPGYYESKKTYNIETIVYDARTGEKLWWAVSETVYPDTVEKAVHEIAEATAKRMKDDGVIR